MNTSNTLIATFAALFVLQSASAAAPIHRMPANDRQLQPSYQLKINAPAIVGAPLVVTLVNQADGQVVRNAEITVQRTVFAGPKASPMFRNLPLMLTRAADGSFVCDGRHHVAGERLTLRGAGPDVALPVWLTLTVKG